MRQTLAAVLFLFGVVARGEAFDLPHWGRCKTLPVIQNFDLSDYEGTWFQQAGYNDEATKYNLRCVHALYGYDSDHNDVTVHNLAIRNKDNHTQGINGTAVFADPSKDEGRLVVTFHPYWWLKVQGNYWILNTNYQSYSVVYSCDNFFFFFHYYTVWFLSRNQHLSPRQQSIYFNQTNTILKNVGLDYRLMKRTSQSNCNYRRA